MPEPTPSDLKFYGGSDGTPQNDSDPIGGFVDTGVELNENTPNLLIYQPKINASDEVYRSIAYRQNEATGSLSNARMSNRAGGVRPTSSGALKFSSTSAADTGQVRITYKSASNWLQQDLTLNGINMVVGANVIDIGSDFVIEAKAGPFVGDIKVEVGTQVLGYLWGTVTGDPTEQLSTLYELALATAINTDLSAANRRSDPGGISAFALAQDFPGNDGSIEVPGGALFQFDYIGYCERLTIPANLPKPFLGLVRSSIDIKGDPLP